MSLPSSLEAGGRAIHHRDTEGTEGAQRVESSVQPLRTLCLCGEGKPRKPQPGIKLLKLCLALLLGVWAAWEHVRTLQEAP